MSARIGITVAGSQITACSVAALMVLGLSLTAVNEVTWEQRALAFVMFAMSTLSYTGWRAQQAQGLPVFAILASVYGLFFAFALFWGRSVSPSFLDEGQYLPERAVTAALRMAVFGLASMWLGMRFGLARMVFSSARLPDIPAEKLRSAWIRGLVVFGALGSFVYAVPNSLSGLRNAVIILFVFVPLVPFALLLDAYWARTACATDKMLIGIFLVCRIGGGMATGSLTSVVALGFVIAASFVRARKTIPWSAIVVTICVMLFLQPGKAEYRHRFGHGGDQGTVFERGEYWIGTSWKLWSAFVRNADPTVFADLASMTVERASLLTQAALVYDKTPDVVPFQRGATYKYMAVTLVPRFLWPAKPSVNEANQFYQVAYGLTRENELTSVSMAVGVLPEAFMNFGWIGVIAVMFLMGIVYEAYQHICFSAHSGRFAGAVGLALIMQVILIEGQMAQYLGGIVQQVVLAFVLLLPVLRSGGRSSDSRACEPHSDALRFSSVQFR